MLLPGGVGFCNAVRRALVADVRMWAPCEVEVRANTSCQTDEFLAHRIGLVPFRRVADGGKNEMTLRVQGRTALAGDLSGPNFEAVHAGVEIVPLGPGQALDLTVRFDERAGRAHARYACCAAVGMEEDASGHHRLRFETLDGRSTTAALREALDALEARVDGALRQLAHQPAEPPRSMC